MTTINKCDENFKHFGWNYPDIYWMNNFSETTNTVVEAEKKVIKLLTSLSKFQHNCWDGKTYLLGQ
jgi:hypothetical protein